MSHLRRQKAKTVAAVYYVANRREPPSPKPSHLLHRKNQHSQVSSKKREREREKTLILFTGEASPGGGGAGGEEQTIQVDEASLRKCWDCDAEYNKEDWTEWMRRFSVGLLAHSPDSALRSCLIAAEVRTPKVQR